MPIQEDDWELDINLGSDSTHNIFQRKGVFSFEPDKELVLACERYQYPTQSIYFDDDDTNSSIASSSIVSSRYSELDASLNNLDDFMYDDPPVVETTIPQINQQDLPGVVKRLGLPARYRQVQDNDDWNDDIDMPSKGISLNHVKRSLNDRHSASCSFDDAFDIDIGPSVIQEESCSRPPLFGYEPEQEDDDMTGIDFPDNMALLPKRLDTKKRQAPINAKPSISVATTTKIPTAGSCHRSKALAHIPRECDDDDFFDGLNIKEDKAFTINTPAFKMSTQRAAPLSKGKAIPTATFVSRLARPTPLSQYKKTAAEQLVPNASTSATKKSPRRFLAGTQASIHREAEIAAKRTTTTINSGRPKTKNMSSLSKPMNLPAEKKSASGYTLIARPKTKVATGYYCSRLDSIDNLVDLRPKRIFYPKGENKADPMRPWRRNMQSTADPSKSKVKLIQPSEQSLKKEYNNMKYDEVTHSWKGNETSLVDFQEKPARRSRLMLMTQKQQKPSKYAAVVGNNMIFNAESQKWVSAFGEQEECNELDEIEDLKEELYQMPSRRSHNKKVEFKLSVETKRQMMYDQEKHESWIKHWPLKTEEPEIVSRSGHPVKASKYFLIRQNY